MKQSYLDISETVAQALAQSRPIVALESTIISHGMPYPKNVETALQVEAVVTEHGAVPATIAIINGRLKVGLSHHEITLLGKNGEQVTKTSRRDIPFIVALGRDGATTVSATMIIAEMAGINVFATGGIGGVHRGAQDSMDISADLTELARTNVAVVCAGIKSVLDIPRTLEYLETQGVPVIGYGCDVLPAFYTRDSGSTVDYRLETPDQVARALSAKWSLGMQGGAVIANPIPEQYALDPIAIETLIADTIDEMNTLNITGKDTTPFMLRRIAEQTHGDSLEANIQLVFNNARVAAQIAVAYSEQNEQ